MSMFDYRLSQEIECQQYSFYALIMAAMRQADDINIKKLKAAFPDDMMNYLGDIIRLVEL